MTEKEKAFMDYLTFGVAVVDDNGKRVDPMSVPMYILSEEAQKAWDETLTMATKNHIKPIKKKKTTPVRGNNFTPPKKKRI